MAFRDHGDGPLAGEREMGFYLEGGRGLVAADRGTASAARAATTNGAGRRAGQSGEDAAIERNEFVQGDDTAPIVVAVTIETAPR